MSCSRTQRGDPSGARTPEDFCEALSSENLLVSYPFQYLNRGVPIAQLEERRNLDHKVEGSILPRGAVLRP